jgi:hypothetical protein
MPTPGLKDYNKKKQSRRKCNYTQVARTKCVPKPYNKYTPKIVSIFQNRNENSSNRGVLFAMKQGGEYIKTVRSLPSSRPVAAPMK